MPRLYLFIALLLSSSLSFADDYLTIEEAYIREMPPGVTTTAAFMQIHNLSQHAATLVSASSPQFGKVEIHEMVMEGDVMKMRQMKHLKVKAQQHVELKPGGKHLMLFNLKAPLAEGELYDVTLVYQDGREQSLQLPSRKIMAKMKHQH